MKNKNVLMCVALVFLIILLLLPVGLRLFAKDLYNSKKEKPKDAVLVLNCTKLNETINTSYVNGKPYNFQYQLLSSTSVENSEENYNEIVLNIKDYAERKESDTSGVIEYRIALNKYTNYPQTLQNYVKNIDEESIYYNGKGFTCTTISNE